VARRRSVREFDTRPVPREVIEHALRAAGTRYRHCDVPESVGTASACW
jgi:nitroreductase